MRTEDKIMHEMQLAVKEKYSEGAIADMVYEYFDIRVSTDLNELCPSPTHLLDSLGVYTGTYDDYRRAVWFAEVPNSTDDTFVYPIVIPVKFSNVVDAFIYIAIPEMFDSGDFSAFDNYRIACVTDLIEEYHTLMETNRKANYACAVTMLKER